jgi:hypothetical protein
MPFRNRVDPYGEIVSTPLRGAWMGNRGCIHRDHEIVRVQATRRWITCALEYKGWGRPQWLPGRWTAIFFYDEALAFAAGHRPCALCRRDAYKRYCVAIGMDRADPIDAILDQQRLEGKKKRTHALPWRDLPAGAYVEIDGAPHVVLDESVRPWSAQTGYEGRIARPTRGNATVLTPPLTLRAFANGYSVQITD